MDDLEQQFNEINEFSLYLERNNFIELQKWLDNLAKTDKPKYGRFNEAFDDEILWANISRHKISLSKVIADKSGVVATENDHTRVVLTLAKLKNKSFDDAKAIMVKEFGSYFMLQPSYKIGQKSITINEISQKAIEVKNGLKNVCRLMTDDAVKEIMGYFKSSSINDHDRLEKLRETIYLLLQDVRDPLAAFGPNNYPALKPRFIEFYKMTNRTQTDILALDEPNADEIRAFVFMMAEVTSTKLTLLKKGYAPNDIPRAREIIIDGLAEGVFQRRLSFEEIVRIGIPLPPKI